MAKLSMLMLTTTAVAAIFFHVSTAQTTQYPVTCYQCSYVAGIGDANCQDGFKSSGISSCQGVQCFKTYGSALGVNSISRGCYYVLDDTNNNKCNSASAGSLASGTTCLCNSNNCNAASGLHSGHVTGVLALVAALTMAYFGRRML